MLVGRVAAATSAHVLARGLASDAVRHLHTYRWCAANLQTSSSARASWQRQVDLHTRNRVAPAPLPEPLARPYLRARGSVARLQRRLHLAGLQAPPQCAPGAPQRLPRVARVGAPALRVLPCRRPRFRCRGCAARGAGAVSRPPAAPLGLGGRARCSRRIPMGDATG